MSTKKTVLITGANAGIGFQVALHFARTGAAVVLACRNPDKAARARAAIEAAVPGASLTVLPLDVSEPASIRAFGEHFAREVGTLDVLINNAGIVAQPLTRNSAGHEMQLATNHLGAFALTGMLLPAFRAGGRIVNVGSLAHLWGKLNVDDLNWQRAAYSQWRAYANSKLAAVCHAFELQRRLRESGSHVIALAAHPGFAGTDIVQKSESLRSRTRASRWFTTQFIPMFVPTAEMAARALIEAASTPDAKGGEYYGPTGLLETHGKPGRARYHATAACPDLGGRLWRASEELTGVRYLT